MKADGSPLLTVSEPFKLFGEFLDYAKKRVAGIEDENLTNRFVQITESMSETESMKVGSVKIEPMNAEWCQQAFIEVATFITDNHVAFDREGITLATSLVDKLKIERLNVDTLWLLKLRGIKSAGYVKGSWKLEDGEKMALENPYTFYKPSLDITKHLQVGNIVKLMFSYQSTNPEHPSGERMWVSITEVNEDGFIGELENYPFALADLFVGDSIEFEHKHIIDHDLEMTEDNLVDKYLPRCLVTRAILYENAPINYICRDEPVEQSDDHEYPDSGWCFYSNEETDEYLQDDKNFQFVSLGAVLKIDDSFIDVLASEVGTAFERGTDGAFHQVEYEHEPKSII